jgi:hypothetical protein
MSKAFDELTGNPNKMENARAMVQELIRQNGVGDIMRACPILIVKTLLGLIQTSAGREELIEDLLKTFQLETLFTKGPLKASTQGAWSLFTSIVSAIFYKPEYYIDNAVFYLHLVDPSDPFYSELKERARLNNCTEVDCHFTTFVKELQNDYEHSIGSRASQPLLYHPLGLVPRLGQSENKHRTLMSDLLEELDQIEQTYGNDYSERSAPSSSE